MFKRFNLKAAGATLGLAIMLTGAGAVAPVPTMAQGYNYDGYCYVKKEDLAGRDAALGAIGGGIAGALLGGRHKGQDAVVGAAVGGTAGYVVGRNSNQKVRCSKGHYYVYTHGYYPAPQAPRGFKEVYFEERPADFDLYYIDHRGRVRPYRGH